LASGRYTFVDHTADLAVRLQGRTLDDVFAAAAAALTEAMTDSGRVEPRHGYGVKLVAPNPETLLVDWIGELLYRFEAAGWLVAAAQPRVTRDGDRWRLYAFIEGEKRDPARHPIKVLVKAATYHGLHLTETPEGYDTLLVFDI
jgi:SHS2 domain-containing protein